MVYDPSVLPKVASSTNPNTDVYIGPSAFSEVETQNIKWLLNIYPARAI
jgi:hypothetical protein